MHVVYKKTNLKADEGRNVGFKVDTFLVLTKQSPLESSPLRTKSNLDAHQGVAHQSLIAFSVEQN